MGRKAETEDTADRRTAVVREVCDATRIVDTPEEEACREGIEP
jgi:hypothetical protein